MPSELAAPASLGTAAARICATVVALVALSLVGCTDRPEPTVNHSAPEAADSSLAPDSANSYRGAEPIVGHHDHVPAALAAATPAALPEARTAAAAPLPGTSLYHLASAWTDQAGGAFRLPELRGSAAVFVMFYGDCTTACPLLVRGAELIEAALPDELRQATSFVLVSFDTERDSSARLKEYAASKGLDRDGWHWLVGTPLQTRQLAALLGVQYRDAGNGMFAHSNLITVLDAEGVPAARLEGLGADPGPAVDTIVRLAGS